MAPKNVPTKSRVTGNDYTFHGSGDASIDTVSWGKLVDVIQQQNKPATITIADRVQPTVLDAAISGFANGKTCNQSLIIRGETRHARLRLENGFQLGYGGYSNQFIPTQTPDPAYITRGAFNGCAARVHEVVVDDAAWLQAVNAGAGPLPGDMISLSSLDTLPGCDPHLPGGQNCPGEIHRVARVVASTFSGLPRLTITLSTRVEDAMTTSPVLCHIRSIKNCGIENITLDTTYTGNVGHNQTTFLSARRCDGFFMENIYAEKMPGTPVFFNCLDVNVNGIKSGGVIDPLGDYGLAIGPVNGFFVSECSWYHARHVFTTGGQTLTESGYTSAGTWSNSTAYVANQWVSYTPAGASVPSKYLCITPNTGQQPNTSPTYWFQLDRVWGTPQNGIVKACRAFVPGSGSTSWVGFDTHSSGTGIVFIDCEVTSTVSGFNAIGFSSRSRATRFERCKVKGASSQWTIGFHLRGADNECRECVGDTLNEGVRIDAGVHGGVYHGRKIHDCQWNRVFSSAVRVTAGINDVHVSANKCASVASGNASPLVRSAITFQGGTGHIVRGNHLDKQSSGGNLYSVDSKALTPSDVKIHGNYCSGYGAGVAGLLSDTAAGAAFESAYASKNYTD